MQLGDVTFLSALKLEDKYCVCYTNISRINNKTNNINRLLKQKLHKSV